MGGRGVPISRKNISHAKAQVRKALPHFQSASLATLRLWVRNMLHGLRTSRNPNKVVLVEAGTNSRKQAETGTSEFVGSLT